MSAVTPCATFLCGSQALAEGGYCADIFVLLKGSSLGALSCRAFATLGHDPGVILLDAAACQMVDNIIHFRPQVCTAFVTSHVPTQIYLGNEAIKTLTQVVSAKEQSPICGS